MAGSAQGEGSLYGPWQALDPDARFAWRGLLLAHRMTVIRLDAELEAATGWNLSAFEVLLALSHAPDQRMQMSLLADAVIVSRSGLTRQVDRLQAAGLVRRQPGAADPRQVYACLTDAGRDLLRDAIDVHVEGIRRHFLDRLSKGQVTALANTWRRLARIDPALARHLLQGQDE